MNMAQWKIVSSIVIFVSIILYVTNVYNEMQDHIRELNQQNIENQEMIENLISDNVLLQNSINEYEAEIHELTNKLRDLENENTALAENATGEYLRGMEAGFQEGYIDGQGNPVTVYKDPAEFPDLETLKSFLAADDTNEILLLKVGKIGATPLNGQCENYVMNLEERARSCGYRITTEMLTKVQCTQYQRYLGSTDLSMAYNDYHMINKAIIGNEVYFIEPQNDKVWLAAYLD